MFWINVLAIISFLLILTGVVSAFLKIRRYRRHSDENRARALVEMMMVADQAGKGEEED